MSFIDKVTGKEMIQLELPGMPTERAHTPDSAKGGAERWYYICKRRGELMLALDGAGEEIWIPHDTVRETPHLFSSWQAARAHRLRRKTGVDIHRYVWAVKR